MSVSFDIVPQKIICFSCPNTASNKVKYFAKNAFSFGCEGNLCQNVSIDWRILHNF